MLFSIQYHAPSNEFSPAGMESLTSLTLEGATDPNIVVDDDAFGKLKDLKRLVIADSPKLAQQVLLSPAILESLKHLEYLELRDNLLDSIGRS